MGGLIASPNDPICHAPSTHLYVHLDDHWHDNKCIFVKAFWSMLLIKWIFREIYVSCILVCHTHNDIDASFGMWAIELHKKLPTILFWMKIYMQMEKVATSPHNGPCWQAIMTPLPQFAPLLPYPMFHLTPYVSSWSHGAQLLKGRHNTSSCILDTHDRYKENRFTFTLSFLLFSI